MEHESTNPSSFSKNPKQPILEDLITNFSTTLFASFNEIPCKSNLGILPFPKFFCQVHWNAKTKTTTHETERE